ncbi:MAG: DUF819 family protein [Pseudomonadota bacterium]
MASILYFAFFAGVPLLILLATRHIPLAAKLGSIILCYAIGLIVGVSGLLPDAAYAPRTTLTEVSLVLALPMLLFSIDIRAWRRIAGTALLSMLGAVIAVVTVATLLFFWLDSRGTPAAEELSAMTVGMYTGGVANLAAMKVALSIPEDRFAVFATVDTAVGAAYLLFMLTLGRGIFGRVLKPFDDAARLESLPDTDTAPDRRLPAAIALALIPAAACVGLALLIAPMIGFAQFEVTVIVLLTTFGLLGSLIRAIRQNRLAEPLGMFLIYVFTFCVAASLDLTTLLDVDLTIVAFVILATIGTVLLHAAICRVTGVDTETFLVTSVAALLSPAFVPMIVERLRNPALLMSGMSVGILGFAIGNYLGITLALILAS